MYTNSTMNTKTGQWILKVNNEYQDCTMSIKNWKKEYLKLKNQNLQLKYEN